MGNHAFLGQYSKGKHRKVKKRLRAQSKAPAYLFVFNNPLTYIDAQGLLSFHSNCDDPSALLAADKTTLSQKMADAKAKLQDYEDGNITLGANLTDSMATCIKGKLDSVTLS